MNILNDFLEFLLGEVPLKFLSEHVKVISRTVDHRVCQVGSIGDLVQRKGRCVHVVGCVGIVLRLVLTCKLN